MKTRIAALTSLALLAGIGLAGCAGPSVLNPQGPIAAANRTILLNSLAIMLVIVIPTIIGILIFAWWYRASNTKARHQPNFVYSGRIELIVWSIPLLVILFLGGVIWVGSHELDPFRQLPGDEKPIEVQVVSLDWKWLFIYPDQGVASVNELVIPAGKPVHFSLSSATVMNSFFVPQLGSMIAVMNGMVTQLNLKADQPGTYYGQSTQFSGDGFSDMHFNVRAVLDGDFEAWINKVKGAGEPLNKSSYSALAQPSQAVSPKAFGTVDQGLFQDIVKQPSPPVSTSAKNTPSAAMRDVSGHQGTGHPSGDHGASTGTGGL
ncbi:ubiquinol oxidase subunit II [Allorhizobium taibaishanense]|nr:ubiquinol oxidase subunit II [Allorhizobium taibaishanense]MBB4008599.1 cytochrome o ubiquinol oxidase subunit 2 [Allorhizobium taibaishanense]